MPDRLRDASRPPALHTPWERLRAHLRARRDRIAHEEPVDTGARHVRTGTTIAAVAMGASGAITLGTLDRPVPVLGALAFWAVTLVALRRGSRGARWIAMLQAALGVVGAANLVAVVARGVVHGALAGRGAVISLALLVASVGLGYATMTRPAQAWFAAKAEERARRRPRAATMHRWREGDRAD